MRHAALLLLLCACSSLSSTEQEQLASHQRNAKRYWQGALFTHALVQIEKGLALDPDDYMLSTMRGSILLKLSPSSQGTDHRLLDQATEVLERVFDTRSESRHEPSMLFNYALVLQKQARRNASEATRLEALAARAGVIGEAAKIEKSKIEEHRRIAKDRFDRGHGLLGVLIERGELLRMCYKHLLLGARDTGNVADITKHSEAYFERVDLEQKLAKSEVKRTNEPGYERDQKIQLVRLRTEELSVRALLADYHYKRDEFEKALEMLNRTIEIDPQRSADYYNRGRVLLQLNRDSDAKSDFKKFLASTNLPPSSEKAIFAATTISN